MFKLLPILRESKNEQTSYIYIFIDGCRIFRSFSTDRIHNRGRLVLHFSEDIGRYAGVSAGVNHNAINYYNSRPRPFGKTAFGARVCWCNTVSPSLRALPALRRERCWFHTTARSFAINFTFPPQQSSPHPFYSMVRARDLLAIRGCQRGAAKESPSPLCVFFTYGWMGIRRDDTTHPSSIR